MKKLIYILVLLIPCGVLGQIDSCVQYKKVINYFKSDSAFVSCYNGVKLKFRVNEKISSGGIHPFVTYDYIAGKLGLANQNMVFSQDTAIIYPMARKIEQEEYSDTTEYVLPCLSDLGAKRSAKININFYRKESDVLVVYTGRIYKKTRHTYGMIHLFFFDENNTISKVFDSNWIE